MTIVSRSRNFGTGRDVSEPEVHSSCKRRSLYSTRGFRHQCCSSSMEAISRGGALSQVIGVTLVTIQPVAMCQCTSDCERQSFIFCNCLTYKVTNNPYLEIRKDQLLNERIHPSTTLLQGLCNVHDKFNLNKLVLVSSKDVYVTSVS